MFVRNEIGKVMGGWRVTSSNSHTHNSSNLLLLWVWELVFSALWLLLGYAYKELDCNGDKLWLMMGGLLLLWVGELLFSIG